MAYKLIEPLGQAAHVNTSHLVALVRAGAKFEKGVLAERTEHQSGGDARATCQSTGLDWLLCSS
jgi:hypothetical protein